MPQSPDAPKYFLSQSRLRGASVLTPTTDSVLVQPYPGGKRNEVLVSRTGVEAQIVRRNSPIADPDLAAAYVVRKSFDGPTGSYGVGPSDADGNRPVGRETGYRVEVHGILKKTVNLLATNPDGRRRRVDQMSSWFSSDAEMLKKVSASLTNETVNVGLRFASPDLALETAQAAAPRRRGASKSSVPAVAR